MSGEVVARAWKWPSSSSAAGRSVSNDALSNRFESPSERVGAGGQAARQFERGGHQLVGFPDALVREPEIDGFGAGSSLSEHHHGLGARQPDEPRQEVRTARVGDEAPLRERPHEPATRVHEHEVARERQVRARADRRTVDRGDRRLVELPQFANEGLHARSERLGGAARRESRFAGLDDGRRAEVHPGAEGVARARDQHGPHLGIGAEITDRGDDAVAHRDRQRVLCLGPVEHDAPDAVGVALDA